MNIFQFVVARVWWEEGLAVPPNYGEPGAPDVEYIGPTRRRTQKPRPGRRSWRPNSASRRTWSRSPLFPLSETGELKAGSSQADLAIEVGRTDERIRIREAERERRK